VGGVGGWSVRPISGRVQRSIEGYGAWWGSYGAPESWAGVASCRHCRAMQTCMKNRARGGTGARERRTCSGRAGRSGRSSWHGRGSVRGRSRAGLAQGIDPWVHCEAGGKVMAWEVVGGALTKHGVHRW
jgi:hypothetical protein